MFEHLHTVQDVFQARMGAALKMEVHAATMLREATERAHDPRVMDLLQSHLRDGPAQHENLGAAFAALGFPLEDAPSSAMHGIQKDARTLAKKSDDQVVDLVLLQDIEAAELYKIATYDHLVAHSIDFGVQDATDALQAALHREHAMLERVRDLHRELEAATAGDPTT